jgi:Protein of unknown function (DUF3128)
VVKFYYFRCVSGHHHLNTAGHTVMESDKGQQFQGLVLQEEVRLRKAHPTTDDVPSCMSLLDDFLSCNGMSSKILPLCWITSICPSVLGVQLKSLYRYGERSKCGYKMEDFKFCMSNKSLHPEQKRDAWIHRRAEWWATRRMTKSSEDVWEMRTSVPSL